MNGAPADAPSLSTVHLLTVHGVGGHDHLSDLLRTYQSFRANLRSVEAPIEGEDQIPGWRLVQFEEGATPPVLTIRPRETPTDDGVGTVCLYEVNYSGSAGVIRRNQPIDLTGLFLGLDVAVCAARLRLEEAPPTSTILGGDSAKLGRCLQQVAGVLAAGTVPIIGLPAIVFRNYIGTFIATFTRFFEDVATFVLDKNGEQLISAHLDRTMATIAKGFKAGDRLVVAAHSLGSVVVHNYVVRRWTSTRTPGEFPDTVITFGSPIGLMMWLWLFLDFDAMDYQKRVPEHYLCWNPVSSGTSARTSLSWINVVNCGDPIATAFPVEALDLSTTAPVIAAALKGGTIAHRFYGPENVTSVGAAHGQYLNDKKGFIAILLRASGLVPSSPEDVPSARTAREHSVATQSVLLRLQDVLLGIAAMAIVVYCGVVARAFGDRRALWFAALFAWPPVTIGILAFFQRLLLGGPTKRISTLLIREMKWSDLVAFPYRLRDRIAGPRDAKEIVNPMAPSHGYLARLAVNAISFTPTLVAMTIPIAGTAWLTGRWPTAAGLWERLWSVEAVVLLVAFMVYVVSCAAHELVRTWRHVVKLLAGGQTVGDEH